MFFRYSPPAGFLGIAMTAKIDPVGEVGEGKPSSPDKQSATGVYTYMHTHPDAYGRRYVMTTTTTNYYSNYHCHYYDYYYC